MPLVNIVLALIVVGVALWLINRFIPMAGSIKTILNAVVVIVVCSVGPAGHRTLGTHIQLPYLRTLSRAS